MSDTKPEPVVIPEDAFALIFLPNNQMKVVTPELSDEEPMTDGHFLILGLMQKIQEPGWANSLIEETVNNMQSARNG